MPSLSLLPSQNIW